MCYDYKTQAATFTKTQRSFKISDARVLQVAGDKLGFKAVYGGDFCHYICYSEEGKKWYKFKPVVPPDVNCVKLAKGQDVVKLLDELGVNQTMQKYYQDALSDASDTMLAYRILRKARMMRGVEPEDFRRGMTSVAMQMATDKRFAFQNHRKASSLTPPWILIVIFF